MRLVPDMMQEQIAVLRTELVEKISAQEISP